MPETYFISSAASLPPTAFIQQDADASRSDLLSMAQDEPEPVWETSGLWAIVTSKVVISNPMVAGQTRLSDSIRAVAGSCCESHLSISIDENVLGGIPHIAGTRLSIGQILGRLYVLGGIDEVAAYYRGNITPNQIREALAYAQDFIESVCEPSESHGR